MCAEYKVDGGGPSVLLMRLLSFIMGVPTRLVLEH